MTETAESPQPTKRRRILVGAGLFLLLLISLLILGVAYENWSGAKEWKRVEEKLVRGGVELDPKKLIPVLPAPENNFAAHPLLRSLVSFDLDEKGKMAYHDPDSVKRFRRMRLPVPHKDYPPHERFPFVCASWEFREPADFGSVFAEPEKVASRVEALRGWMAEFESDLAGIDHAALRGEAVFPIDLAGDFLSRLDMRLPHLNDLMRHQEFQAFRVCAALEAGDHETARSGIRTMRQISRASGSQPELICHLIRLANLDRLIGAIWHGVNAELWREDDLRWLGEELSGLSGEIQLGFQNAINMELCVMTIGSCDYMRSLDPWEGNSTGFFGAKDSKTGWWLALLPNGIWDHNKAFGADYVYEHALRATMERDFRKDQPSLATMKTTHRNFFAGVAVPVHNDMILDHTQAVASIELARVSIAVERFRIGEGHYPESLEPLVPRFLSETPADPFSTEGNPLSYRREGDRYLVYSVGTNQWDDPAGSDSKTKPSVDLGWGFQSLDVP